jgi:RNA polymerase sigma factor (sigma-70 family)
MEQVETRIDLVNAMRGLAARDLMILDQLFYQGASVEETAAFIGISRQAVHRRFRRMAARLRRALAG